MKVFAILTELDFECFHSVFWVICYLSVVWSISSFGMEALQTSAEQTQALAFFCQFCSVMLTVYLLIFEQGIKLFRKGGWGWGG